MSLKKILLTLTLAASFGLVACGDDSSTSPSDSGKSSPSTDKSGKSSKGDDSVVHCSFSSDETSFKMETTDGDTTATITGTLENDVLTMVTIVAPADDDACTDLDEGEKCEIKDGNEVITTTVDGLGAEMTFSMSVPVMEEQCKDMDGKTKKEIEGNGDFDDEDGDFEGGECDEQCMEELEKALEEMFGEGMDFEE